MRGKEGMVLGFDSEEGFLFKTLWIGVSREMD
jgi:hypothetical protein